jgi:hypothetical protein
MKWFRMDISFDPSDHPKTQLSDQNLPFMVKMSIDKHNVAKRLFDNGSALNLFMRQTFLEMGL